MWKAICAAYLVIIVTSTVALAQPGTTESAPDTTLRTSYFLAGIGYPDLFALGYGWQVQDDVAVGAKVNNLLVGSDVFGLISALGIGVSGAWYFQPEGSAYLLGINAVSLEASYSSSARGIELAMCHDPVPGKDLGLYWGLGVGCVLRSHRSPECLPIVKIGICQNL